MVVLGGRGGDLGTREGRRRRVTKGGRTSVTTSLTTLRRPNSPIRTITFRLSREVHEI